MSETLERLRTVRRSHRGVVTKLTKETDTLLVAETRATEQIDRLIVIRQQLTTKEQTLQELNRDILNQCSLEDVEGEVNEAETVLAKIMDYRRRIDAALQPTSLATHTASTIPAVVVASPPAAVAKPRLPKLNLVKFKGDVTSWVPFWDSFKSAVHENGEVSKIDKFNYLHSLLEGAAALSIQGLSLTADNYDSAIELLKNRFGNTQLIIATHMEELFKLPACTGERAQPLRRLYDKMMVHIRGLQSLGVETTHYGRVLLHVLMSKLPESVSLRVARENREESWEINQVMRTILTEVEARETSEGSRILTQKSVAHPRTHISGSNPTASSLVTNGYSVRCVYCGEAHYSASCKKIASVKNRKEALIKMGRCFVCLKSSHRAKDCDSRRNCRYCHRRHHQSLCELQSTEQGERKEDQTVPVENTTATTVNTVKSRQLVLLQTAQAEATNETGTRVENVRVLFDNGSQRSYITDSLKIRLGLSPIRKEKLNLNTFGDGKFKTQNCDVVRVHLRRPENLYSINALSFPTICSALPSPVDLSAYPMLSEFELADHDATSNQDHTDILVGSDFYWSLITEEIIHTEGGLIAAWSTLGWLISGPVETSSTGKLIHTHAHLAISCFTESNFSESPDDQLVTTLKKFWEVETLGTESIEKASSDDKFLHKLKFDGKRYEVGLPWIGDHIKLSDDREPCFSRLKLLHKRLLKNPEILFEYDNVIQEQLEKGVIERVPICQIDEEKGPIHYMPHHPVIRRGKSTTKVRIVYDGSAKSKESGLSLNDCLQTGPNLIPKLFDVLARFRSQLIAVTADIEKAFLMIGICESNRNMLCFLWFNDLKCEDSEVIQLRFTHLVLDLQSSPAILGAVIAHHVHKYMTRSLNCAVV